MCCGIEKERQSEIMGKKGECISIPITKQLHQRFNSMHIKQQNIG